MIKFLDTIPAENLKEKRVLLRVDFNVPLQKLNLSSDGMSPKTVIADDFKVKAHRETIDYLLQHGAKILLVSHFDALKTFLPIAEELGEILGQTISLVPHSEMPLADNLFQASPILLLDNIRQDKREEANDDQFARGLSRGFDFYINDAFSVSHRDHALITAVTRHLPSFGGFLMKKETENLSAALRADPKGKILVLGGAKISTKLPVINNFLDKAEKILIGGALANDIWQQQGISVGVSLVDNSVTINQLGNQVSKLVLPTDIVIAKGWTLEKVKNLISQGSTLDSLKVEPLISEIRNLETDEAIVDIGPQSAEKFAAIIKNSAMVIWNGPMGLAEVEPFAHGTEVIAKAVAEAKKSIVGGGETIAAAAKLDLLDKFGYVSTGGGAMLAFLAGSRLPGLEALGYYE